MKDNSLNKIKNASQMPVTDKLALINLAINVVKKLRDIGKTDNEIVSILKDYNFSDQLIEQIT